MIQRMFRCRVFRKQVRKYMDMLANLKYKLHFKLAAYRMKKYAKEVVKLQRFLRCKIIHWKRAKMMATAKLV